MQRRERVLQVLPAATLSGVREAQHTLSRKCDLLGIHRAVGLCAQQLAIVFELERIRTCALGLVRSTMALSLHFTECIKLATTLRRLVVTRVDPLFLHLHLDIGRLAHHLELYVFVLHTMTTVLDGLDRLGFRQERVLLCCIGEFNKHTVLELARLFVFAAHSDAVDLAKLSKECLQLLLQALVLIRKALGVDAACMGVRDRLELRLAPHTQALSVDFKQRLRLAKRLCHLLSVQHLTHRAHALERRQRLNRHPALGILAREREQELVEGQVRIRKIEFDLLKSGRLGFLWTQRSSRRRCFLLTHVDYRKKKSPRSALLENVVRVSHVIETPLS